MIKTQFKMILSLSEALDIYDLKIYLSKNNDKIYRKAIKMKITHKSNDTEQEWIKNAHKIAYNNLIYL